MAVEVRDYFLALFCSEFLECFFGNRQHAASSRRSVIEQVRAGFDGVGNRKEEKVRHQLDGVTRGPVFARFFVVLFIELANEFFEHGAHGMVVHRRVFYGTVAIEHWVWTEVDLGVKELGDHCSKSIGF